MQAAVIQFLARPDQTPSSLAETVRVLAVAQAQNPEVNAHLIPLLSSPDQRVQLALLQHLNSLTLPRAAYTAARAKVTQMAADPAAPPLVRSYGTQLLSCWSNDRHRMCMVPCGPNCVTAR